MHWAHASVEARIDGWATELDAVRREVAVVRRSLDDVRRQAAEVVAATAWVSPAMTAFQTRLDGWRDDLARQDYPLERFDAALAEARHLLLLDGAGFRR